MSQSESHNNPLTLECKVHFRSARHGRRRLTAGQAPEPTAVPQGRVPHVTRLMALAVRLRGLLEAGEVTDYAELARLGHVTRARVTQIMNLTLLAPDLQEQVLFLPLVHAGRSPITEHDLRPIAAESEWPKQRRLWGHLRERLHQHLSTAPSAR